MTSKGTWLECNREEFQAIKWHCPHIAYKWLCHLNSLCVVLQTSTHEGFFHFESGLGDWALLNHWVVVGVLGGHLKSSRYMYKTNWNVVTFNSPEARLSKVDTRSWGTPASSSSFTQMWEVSSLRQDLRSKEWSSWNTYGFACQGFLPEGNAQFWDLLLHQLELFKLVPRESKTISFTSVQLLLQISGEREHDRSTRLPNLRATLWFPCPYSLPLPICWRPRSSQRSLFSDSCRCQAIYWSLNEILKKMIRYV